MKLTAKQKKGIRTWLKLPRNEMRGDCPFSHMDSNLWECDTICPALFPRLGKMSEVERIASDWCPCMNYTLAHVRRVARKAVEG